MKAVWSIVLIVFVWVNGAPANQPCPSAHCIALPIIRSAGVKQPEPSPTTTASAQQTTQPETPSPSVTVTEMVTATVAETTSPTATDGIDTDVTATSTVTEEPQATVTATPCAVKPCEESATPTSTLTTEAVPSATSTLTTEAVPSATPTEAVPSATATEAVPSATATVMSDRDNVALFRWKKGKAAPEKRSEAMGRVVGDKLYVFSGYTDTTYLPKSVRADSYDPQTDSWTTLPPMPRPMTHSGIATDGVRYIYLAGGVVGDRQANGSYDKIDAIDEVWRFDTQQTVWAALPSLPAARGAGELALLGRTLHFFGGTGLDRYTSVDDHWTLDLDSGSAWQTAATLPNARNHLSDAVIDGKLYAIGGQEGHNETLVTQTSLHVWDPAQPKRWTELAPLPEGRSHTAGATVVIDGKIYLFGGEEFHNASRSSVYVYDPARNSWSLSNNIPRRAHSGIAGFINGKMIYTTGNLLDTTYIGEMVP
ncbi:hypothetical protein HC891_20300 [Candidatus Gracilibacteria bacterium]|nr:hypothetical protein [Candidatus Gracilibacteria bacterium]